MRVYLCSQHRKITKILKNLLRVIKYFRNEMRLECFEKLQHSQFWGQKRMPCNGSNFFMHQIYWWIFSTVALRCVVRFFISSQKIMKQSSFSILFHQPILVAQASFHVYCCSPRDIVQWMKHYPSTHFNLIWSSNFC